MKAPTDYVLDIVEVVKDRWMPFQVYTDSLYKKKSYLGFEINSLRFNYIL